MNAYHLRHTLTAAVAVLVISGVVGPQKTVQAQGSQHYCNPRAQGYGNWSAEASPSAYSPGAGNRPDGCKSQAGTHLTANDHAGVASHGGFQWNVHVYIRYCWEASTTGVPPGAWNVNMGGNNGANYPFISLGLPTCNTYRAV